MYFEIEINNELRARSDFRKRERKRFRTCKSVANESKVGQHLFRSDERERVKVARDCESG